MKTRILITTLALAALSSAVSTAQDAEQILKGMSAKLGAAKQFTFKATRHTPRGILEGPDVPETAKISVAVSRPNRISIHSVGRERTMRFIADGRTFTVFNETENHYGQVPMRTSLDGLVDRVEGEYGFVPALADFAVSSPYKELRHQARSITYAGRQHLSRCPLGFGGVDCHRVQLAGRAADAELWIGVEDQLPHKMVVTFRANQRPQIRIAFQEWNLNPAISPAEFRFTPPAGAQRVEMWTTARMRAVSTY